MLGSSRVPTYVIKFTIYLCPKVFFSSFRATFCFTNADYAPQLIRTSEGLLSIPKEIHGDSVTQYCEFSSINGDETLQ
jgi:hypothetical protein